MFLKKVVFNRFFLLSLILISSIFVSKSYAQTSFSLAAKYQKFIGGDYTYPFGEVRDFPALYGAEAKFHVGINYRTALTIEGSYVTAIGNEHFLYPSLITARVMGTDFGANLRYYILGAYNDRGGFYAWGGLNGGMYNINFTKREYQTTLNSPLQEANYFQDVQFWLINANIGLGTEVYTGSFYIFADAGFSYNLKDYVSNVTTYTPPVNHFFRANFGVRIPLGGSI